MTVVTREQFTDQNFQNLTDQLRYVPGFIPAQGEGNRDQAIIRGQSTSADFFVNGVRDDIDARVRALVADLIADAQGVRGPS